MTIIASLFLIEFTQVISQILINVVEFFLSWHIKKRGKTRKRSGHEKEEPTVLSPYVKLLTCAFNKGTLKVPFWRESRWVWNFGKYVFRNWGATSSEGNKQICTCDVSWGQVLKPQWGCHSSLRYANLQKETRGEEGSKQKGLLHNQTLSCCVKHAGYTRGPLTWNLTLHQRISSFLRTLH